MIYFEISTCMYSKRIGLLFAMQQTKYPSRLPMILRYNRRLYWIKTLKKTSSNFCFLWDYFCCLVFDDPMINREASSVRFLKGSVLGENEICG